MSSQKKKAELLTSRYIKENHTNALPMVIIKLVELFYDKYLYWKVQKETMKQFLVHKDDQEIYAPFKLAHFATAAYGFF